MVFLHHTDKHSEEFLSFLYYMKYDLIKQYVHNTPLSVSIHLSIIDGNEFYDSH